MSFDTEKRMIAPADELPFMTTVKDTIFGIFFFQTVFLEKLYWQVKKIFQRANKDILTSFLYSNTVKCFN